MPDAVESFANQMGAEATLGIGRLERRIGVGERVYSMVRSAILDGDLAPGAELVTTELAERMGVSRTPIRESIQRLQQDGLVERAANGVAQVRRVHRREVVDLMAIRAELDAYAVRGFVERRSEHGLLDEVVFTAAEMQRIGTDSSRTGEQLVLNDRFHGLIREGSGNQMLGAFMHDTGSLVLRSLMNRLRRHTAIGRNISEHEDIVAALMAGDPTEAERAVRAHTKSATSELLELLPMSIDDEDLR